MGNESVCVFATLLLLFGNHLLGTGDERLVFVRAHAIEPTGKGGNEGKQIVRSFLFCRFLFPWLQHRQRDIKTGKQRFQIFLPEAREPILIRNRHLSHLVLTDQLEQAGPRAFARLSVQSQCQRAPAWRRLCVPLPPKLAAVRSG